MKHWKDQKTLYDRCYYHVRQHEPLVLFGLFNSLVICKSRVPGLLWEDARPFAFAFIIAIGDSLRVEHGSEEFVLEAGQMVFAHSSDGLRVRGCARDGAASELFAVIGTLQPCVKRPNDDALRRLLNSYSRNVGDAPSRLGVLFTADALAPIAKFQSARTLVPRERLRKRLPGGEPTVKRRRTQSGPETSARGSPCARRSDGEWGDSASCRIAGGRRRELSSCFASSEGQRFSSQQKCAPVRSLQVSEALSLRGGQRPELSARCISGAFDGAARWRS